MKGHEMDAEIKRFLEALVARGGTSTAVKLPISGSRDQDRARQKAKRLGLADYDRACGAACHWKITDAGRAALAAQKAQ